MIKATDGKVSLVNRILENPKFRCREQLKLLINRVNPNAFWRRILKHYNIDLVIDAGANDGQTYREMRSYGFKGEIHSFEPCQKYHAMMLKKKDLLWHRYLCALSSESGDAELFISERPQEHSLNVPITVKSVGTETVSVRRLDSLPFNGGNIFLKIDTQGHDLKVWEGAAGMLPKVSLVKIEVMLSDEWYKGVASPLEILQFAESKGFSLVKIMPSGFYVKHGLDSHCDFIFERKEKRNETTPGTDKDCSTERPTPRQIPAGS